MLWYCCRQLQTGNRLVRLLFSIASSSAPERPVVWRCRESNSARYSAAGDGTHNCIFYIYFFRLPTSSGRATMKSVNVKLVCVSNVSAPAGDSGTRDPLATWVKIFPKSNGSVTAGKWQNSPGKYSQNHAPRTKKPWPAKSHRFFVCIYTKILCRQLRCWESTCPPIFCQAASQPTSVTWGNSNHSAEDSWPDRVLIGG